MELILNWLWQGGIVAAATAGVLCVISPARARARYYAAWAACAAVLALPVIPLVWTPASPAISGGPADVRTISMPDDWWTSPAVALGVWALWFGVQALRVAVATTAVRRAKHECRAFPSRLEARLAHWARLRATGRRAQLVLSDRVSAAAVLGGVSPRIAVAPRVLDYLPEADLDRVVLHEWAHVQRRDDVAQAAQLLVRLVAGWHPAIWWLERQLHLEREVACDDIVVAVTGSAKEYAACLTALASLPVAAARRLPVMAVVSRSGLHRRIVRILATRRAAAPSAGVTAVIGALSVGVVAFGVGNLRLVHTALSMPRVPAVVMVPANGVIAPAGPIPIQALRGLRMDPALSVRARTAVRAGSATDRRAAAGIPAVVSGPVPEPEASTVAETTLPLATQPVAALTLAAPITTAPLRPPNVPASGTAASAVASADAARDDARAIWGAAAEAGKAVGRSSENAAVAAAGFFARLGRTVGSSF